MFANIPGVQLSQDEAVKAFLDRGYTGEVEPVGICWEGDCGETIYKRFDELTAKQQVSISKKFGL